MLSAVVDSVELDWCEKCKGAWFDAEELKKVSPRRPPAELSAADIVAGLLNMLPTL